MAPAATGPEGFAAGEQFGGLEFKLLHREVGGHCYPLRAFSPGSGSPEFARVPGRTKRPGLPSTPVAPGRGPGVRLLAYMLYGDQRTMGLHAQSTATDRDRAHGTKTG